MLNLVRLSLLALALFANPVIAACGPMLPSLTDLRELAECVKDQEMTVSRQAGEISLLRKELDYLKEFRALHTKDINTLNDRLLELRIEVSKLQLQKTKPANK